MTIYDTSIYIDKINKHEKIIDEFAVVEFNIYELLKNKDPKHQKEEFYKLDNFVQENNGTYLLSDNFYEKTRLLNSANTPKQYKFKICLKFVIKF